MVPTDVRPQIPPTAKSAATMLLGRIRMAKGPPDDATNHGFRQRRGMYEHIERNLDDINAADLLSDLGHQPHKSLSNKKLPAHVKVHCPHMTFVLVAYALGAFVFSWQEGKAEAEVPPWHLRSQQLRRRRLASARMAFGVRG